MKQRLPVIAGLLGLFVSSGLWAQATTYTYTGPVWTTFGNFTAPCGTGPCANYPAGSKLTGQFTTAAPLASNLDVGNIFPQVISFSFNDGLDTFSSADPNVRGWFFLVGTDASGNITLAGGGIALTLWQTGPSPHAVGNRIAETVIGANFGVSNNNESCMTVGASPSTGVTDSCTAASSDSSTSHASAEAAGTWVKSSGPAVASLAVPTFSFWAMVLLSLFTAAFAFRSLRKRDESTVD
jgi:hypothetical protein